MKKIIILIALIANFGFCDTLVKIYNKTTGQVVKTFNNNDCANNSLWIMDGRPNDVDLEIDKILGVMFNKSQKMFMVGCDDAKNSAKMESIMLGLYDKDLFSFSVEYVEQSLR